MRQVGAEAELCVWRGIGVAVGEWLGVLAAGGAALVQHDDRRPASAAAMAADRPAGPAPTTSTSHDSLRRLWCRRFVAQRCQRQCCVAGHDHAVRHLDHAGALADTAIDGHDAVEAGAHAAMQAARRPGNGVPERDDVGRGQRGGDGLAFQCIDGLVIEAECDGSAGGAYGRVLKSHCLVRLIGAAMLP